MTEAEEGVHYVITFERRMIVCIRALTELTIFDRKTCREYFLRAGDRFQFFHRTVKIYID